MNKQVIDILSTASIFAGGVLIGLCSGLLVSNKKCNCQCELISGEIEEFEFEQDCDDEEEPSNEFSSLDEDRFTRNKDYAYNADTFLKTSATYKSIIEDKFYSTEKENFVKVEEEEPEYPEGAKLIVDNNNMTGVKIISEDDYFENAWEFDKDVLTYYSDDDILTDDRNEVLSNKEYYVGDEALDSFGEMSSDPNSVYIVHYGENKLFEIVLEEGSYSETILGIDTDIFERIGGYDRSEKES